MSGLAPLPDSFAESRDALQRVAAHVLARRRSDVTGRIGLRASPGGATTPAFGDGAEVVRTDGTALIVERDGWTTATCLTSLRAAAESAGVDLAGPLSLGGDAPGIGDPDAALRVDERSARVLADWFAFATTALDETLVHIGPGASPSSIQLWPEHFDVACDAAWGAGDGQRVNLGGSPGDAHHPEPYLYVGPWGPERPGEASFWNAPFGAILGYEAVRAAGGGDAPRRAAARFLGHGLDLLTAG
ncbi:MAG: hypothetical protein AB7I38_16160 [Dehalococcoidia bacterium]